MINEFFPSLIEPFHLNASFIQPTFYLIITMLLTGIGLGTHPTQLIFTRHDLRMMIVGAIINYLILPSVIAFICYLFSASPLISLTLFLISSAKGGRFSISYTWALKGNTGASLWQWVFTRIITIMAMPSLFFIYSYLYPNTRHLSILVELDLLDLLNDSFLLFLIPFLSGVCLRLKYPHICTVLHKPLSVISFSFAIVYMILASQANQSYIGLYWSNDFIVIVVCNILSSVIPYWVGRLAKSTHEEAIAMSMNSSDMVFMLVFGILNTFYSSYGIMYIAAFIWAWSTIVKILLLLIMSRVMIPVYKNVRKHMPSLSYHKHTTISLIRKN